MGYIFVACILLLVYSVAKVRRFIRDVSPIASGFVPPPSSSADANLVAAATKFKINCDGQTINRLKKRISDQMPDSASADLGAGTKTIQAFLKYWNDEYLSRWEERVTYLNRYPQFTKNLHGRELHYINTQPDDITVGQQRAVIPILLVHSWPYGSVRDFFALIERLSKPDSILTNTTCAIVVPSLPGSGWSQGSRVPQPDYDAIELAIILRDLMQSLGHQRFYVHADGQSASLVASSLVTLYPDEVLGLHANGIRVRTRMADLKRRVARWWPSLFVYARYQAFFCGASETLKIAPADWHTVLEIALRDNPIGLAAFVLQQFNALDDGKWSALECQHKDAILDIVMMKMMSQSIGTYSSSFTQVYDEWELDRVVSAVPMACARFLDDGAHSMDWQLLDKYANIVQSTYHMLSGRFIASKHMDVIYDDLVDFIRSVNRQNKLKLL